MNGEFELIDDEADDNGDNILGGVLPEKRTAKNGKKLRVLSKALKSMILRKTLELVQEADTAASLKYCYEIVKGIERDPLELARLREQTESLRRSNTVQASSDDALNKFLENL